MSGGSRTPKIIEKIPEGAAFWTGRTVKTRKGGKNDIGIQIENEPIFTRSKADVAKWVVNDPAL